MPSEQRWRGDIMAANLFQGSFLFLLAGFLIHLLARDRHVRADEDDCRRLHRPASNFVGKFPEHIALGATVRVAHGTRWDAPLAHKGRTL